MAKTADEFPCKQVPGNVWYQFKARGHIIGHSGHPGLELRVKETKTDTGWTLTLLDGDEVLSALAVGRPAERPVAQGGIVKGQPYIVGER